nr:N-acetylmuramoyl-L-alanine amidase [Streptomyces oceani]
MPSRRGGTLVIVLATLVPLCFAGWLVWRSAQGSDEGASATPSVSGSSESDRGSPTTPERSGKPTPSPESGDKGEKDESDEEGAKQRNRSLRGMTVVIDPGHNPKNKNHPDKINQTVDIGTNEKACDTTGTATNSGYPEAEFTLDIAQRASKQLRARGATVKLTQDGDRAWGPCIDERALIGNKAEADAVVSIHADGSTQGNQGFHVILPASVHEGKADTSAITGPSRRLGEALADGYHAATDVPTANYLGDSDGLVTRDDLGGLNLSKVPKVFLECGNMRNPREAARFTDPQWRARAADGIVRGITDFLAGER